jgi:NitT/TauT family transport system substrate-binding protein
VPARLDAAVAAGYGINSGAAKKHGIGAMTDARWREFFDTVAAAGVYPKDMDYKAAFTLQFVNKKSG